MLLAIFFMLFQATAHDVTTDASPPGLEAVTPDDAFPIRPRDGLERGYLTVPESDRSSRILRLPVAIIPAAQDAPERAPVVFLSGGPGLGSLSPAQYPGAYPWVGERDFVVYARRGTAPADAEMTCPDVGLAFASEDEAAIAAAVLACREHQVARGVDLDAYNTAMSVADLEALRQALGYDQLSLFALSYGTRLALSYAREHPDRVASMVLDSPLPHAARFDDALPGSIAGVLRRVADACEMQQACADQYPALGDRFAAALESGDPESTTARVLSIVPASSSEISRTPLLMDAVARGDDAILAPLLSSGGQPSSFAWAVRLSVWCSESLPFARRAEGPDPMAFSGVDGAVFQPETCALWDVETRPEAELAPAFTASPTLVLAGELDILTPPSFGVEAARTLSRARLVLLTAGFHTETTNWGGDGCAMTVAAAFFNAPDALIDTDALPPCLSARSYPLFEAASPTRSASP